MKYPTKSLFSRLLVTLFIASNHKLSCFGIQIEKRYFYKRKTHFPSSVFQTPWEAQLSDRGSENLRASCDTSGSQEACSDKSEDL